MDFWFNFTDWLVDKQITKVPAMGGNGRTILILIYLWFTVAKQIYGELNTSFFIINWYLRRIQLSKIISKQFFSVNEQVILTTPWQLPLMTFVKMVELFRLVQGILGAYVQLDSLGRDVKSVGHSVFIVCIVRMN